MRSTVLLTVLFSVSLAGCPRKASTPERPASAMSCTSDADCADPGAPACGVAFRACVDQRCETTPSRTRFCR